MYYRDRGNSLSYMREYSRAVDDLSRAIDLEPSTAELYFRRGTMEIELGYLDQAITDFTKATELTPGDLRFLRARAKAHELKGDAERARADREEVLRREAGPQRRLKSAGAPAPTP
jgi:tetratricopeptide (TPR) repeat protein